MTIQGSMRFLCSPATTMDMGTPPSSKNFQYIFNHVFMPPKLPQSGDDDARPNEGDIALCELAYDAALKFSPYLSTQQQKSWAPVIKMLHSLIITTQIFSKEYLVGRILELKDNGQF